jgi:hypothetical protein
VAAKIKCAACGEETLVTDLPIEMQRLLDVLRYFRKLHDAKGCNGSDMGVPDWSLKKPPPIMR